MLDQQHLARGSVSLPPWCPTAATVRLPELLQLYRTNTEMVLSQKRAVEAIRSNYFLALLLLLPCVTRKQITKSELKSLMLHLFWHQQEHLNFKSWTFWQTSLALSESAVACFSPHMFDRKHKLEVTEGKKRCPAVYLTHSGPQESLHRDTCTWGLLCVFGCVEKTKKQNRRL